MNKQKKKLFAISILSDSYWVSVYVDIFLLKSLYFDLQNRKINVTF